VPDRIAGRRIAYLGLAATTIAAGLWIHNTTKTIGATTRDVLGDALWAVMIVWLVSAIAPRAQLLARSGVALGICVAVELSQLVHTSSIDALRSSTIGHLVLGSGFNPRDLVAYAFGVAGAALVERMMLAFARRSY
jgi:hypothetical protein